MSKKLANIALVAGATLFFAAEPALANDWDGLWIGAGGGYGMAKNKFGANLGSGGVGLSASDELGGAGGFGTISAGYDHSLLGLLVVGAFADYDFGGINSNLSGANFGTENQLSLGGRIGYLVAPTTLFFTTFGYTHADSSDITVPGFGSIARVGDYDGYFIGNGVETLIGNGFSLKAEYRYTSMQTEDANYALGVPSEGISIKPQIQTARLSLNYRFGNGRTEPIDNSIPPITSTWTSFYLGVGAGMAVSNSHAPDVLLGATAQNDGADGGLISFTAGYDYQLSKRFVIGTFADADYTTLENTETFDLLGVGASVRNKFKNILTIGGRLGYLTTPDTLFFVSSGYANAGLGGTTLSVSDACGCGGGAIGETIFNGNRFSGGFVGGGVETRINDALSLKAEYRYMDFASETLTVAGGVAPAGFPTTFDPNIQMGRVSVNWRFSGSPPPPETTTGPLD